MDFLFGIFIACIFYRFGYKSGYAEAEYECNRKKKYKK